MVFDAEARPPPWPPASTLQPRARPVALSPGMDGAEVDLLMRTTTTWLSQTTTLVALVALATLALAGCGDDFGTECSLPDNDAVRAACSGDSDTDARESSTASCVVENIIECDSRVCARYRGSQAFCTVRCDGEEDKSCPQSAFCAEFVIGSGQFYCVKQNLGGR